MADLASFSDSNRVSQMHCSFIVEAHSNAGYRTITHSLGLNRNTVQQINWLKGWQVKQLPVGFRPRARSMLSVEASPNERWSKDMTRVWCGQKDR